MAHTNAQIRHLFAQQNPESDASSGGKNGEGTFWFVGNRLYSYQTPIAKWHRISRGRSVVLITSDGYSVATKTKQLSGLSDALMPNMYLRVPYIGENGGKAPSAYSAQEMHEGNLKYLVERYEEAKARQARNRGEPSISEMADTADTVSKYCDWFDLKAPRLSVDVDFIEIKRAWENRNTPEMKARRKAEKEKRDAAKAVQEAARLKALEGELNDVPHEGRRHGPDLARRRSAAEARRPRVPVREVGSHEWHALAEERPPRPGRPLPGRRDRAERRLPRRLPQRHVGRDRTLRSRDRCLRGSGKHCR
jgi:hypothetical protein